MTAARIFFGWKVVWVAFVIAVLAWGIGFYGPSVILQTLHATRGWPIAIISTAVTVHFLFSALIVVYLPTLHGYFGIAKVTSIGAALTGLGIVAWGNAHYTWQLFPGALLTGAGFAVTNAAAINAMVARWFDRERPKALSLALNGASVGGVVFAPLLLVLISTLGFANAMLATAIGIVALVWPLAACYLVRAPADLGLAPDGYAEGPAQMAVQARLTRGQLLRDRRFVTISMAFALALFAQIGLFTHLITRLSPELGMNGAASALSLATVCAVIGRTLLGWLIGDHGRRLVASTCFVVQATGVLLLTFGGDVALLVIGCILFGLAVGNLNSLPPLIAQQEFESSNVTQVVSLATAINQAVCAFAPALFGVLRELTDSYVLPFTIASVAYVVAAIIVGTGRPRVRSSY
jgi:MFS family permease